MIKMAIFDIDDTLYSHVTESIPASAIEAINKLREKGVLIVIATGREKDKILYKVRDMIDPDYYVVGNGQGIYQKGLVPYKFHFIDKDSVTKISEYVVGKHHKNLYWKFPSGTYAYSDYDGFLKSLTRQQIEYSYNPERDHHLQEEPISGTIETEAFTTEELLEVAPGINYIQMRGCCDVSNVGINKLTSLKDVLELCNVTNEETIAFGDSTNDIEIVKSAKIGVCVATGTDNCKAVCDYITDAPDDDGIYNACKHFGLI